MPDDDALDQIDDRSSESAPSLVVTGMVRLDAFPPEARQEVFEILGRHGEEADVPIKAIFHVNVNCTDLDRSKAFYELLGFRTVIDLPAARGPDMLRGLGLPPGSVARGAIMMIDPDQRRSTRLDLLQWLQPPTWGRPYEDLAHVGVARIALWTVGLDEEVARLRAAGVELLSEPAAMEGLDTRFVCFRDPDGTILELIDFGPGPGRDQG